MSSSQPPLGEIYTATASRSAPYQGRVSPSTAIPSKHPARLGPRGGTLPTSKAAWSESVLGADSAPSDRACVMEGSHSRRSRPDVVSIIKMGGDMVVAFSFNAFARDELLAGRLVSFVDGSDNPCRWSLGKIR